MALFGTVLFAMACGFTMAGLLSSIHGLLRPGEGGAVGLSFASMPWAAWSVILCAFAGPSLSLSLAWPFWRRGQIAGYRMALLGVIAGVWSFCSGVFIIEAGLLAGVLSV